MSGAEPDIDDLLGDLPPWLDLPVGVDRVKELLIQAVTEPGSQGVDAEEYKDLRSVIIADETVGHLAPDFLRDCRTPREFWDYMKPRTSTWAERRRFINDAFRPMYERFEGLSAIPGDSAVTETLQTFDVHSVNRLWTHATQRRDKDPEGAITLARTLLETVCKHILDDSSVHYSPKADLVDLYGAVAKLLVIAPSQHTEQAFKQILQGCTSVVHGLGTLRNRLSDAHGQGKDGVRPSPRHAELAVNLAGAMATFLVATYQARQLDQAAALQRSENIARLTPPKA